MSNTESTVETGATPETDPAAVALVVIPIEIGNDELNASQPDVFSSGIGGGSTLKRLRTTRIVVVHRLSAIREAYRVYVD